MITSSWPSRRPCRASLGLVGVLADCQVGQQTVVSSTPAEMNGIQGGIAEPPTHGDRKPEQSLCQSVCKSFLFVYAFSTEEILSEEKR